MDLDLAEVAQLFREEALEGLAAAEQALLALEARPDDPDALASVFRVVHTVKGNASSLGYGAVADLAHALEDALARMREGRLSADAATVAVLLQGLDALAEGVPAAVAGASGAVAGYGDLLDALRALAGTQAAAPRPAQAAAAVTHSSASGVRVDTGAIDRLLDLTGEIAIAQARLRQTLESGSRAAALEVQEEARRLSAELQDLVMRARLVPLGPIFRRHLRTVRDLAASRSRLARLVIEGEEVQIDMSVAERIRDPLTHLIRNAIDHGIEPPSRRRQLGKDPCGTLTLRARRELSSIVVELEDDGGGLDHGRILARARTRGLVAQEARPSDAELLRLVLEPGFSTADRVSDVSGRGVGLDVVRRNVEALRGSVELDSRAGAGTLVRLRLPLTLLIVSGLVVEAGGETFLVPLDAVVECLDARRLADDGRVEGSFELRGECVPTLELARLFGRAAEARRGQLVVVSHAGQRVGLHVTRVLGTSQAVVKPLGSAFRTQRHFSGGTILGDGRIAPVLDVPALIAQGGQP